MQPLQPGDPSTVGRYRLGGRLGQGGMGQVYWGRSPSGRPVAIKLVHPHLANQPDFRRRFAHEVDAARRVGGFHTAPVVDADPNGDPPWLVTAYVAGPSLAAAVQRAGPFDLPTLRVLGAGLAEALEAVHTAGLVHRDLKPANILLTDDGPRVIDFGIARALDPAQAQHLTATGAAIGTPRYMAPEQFGDETITGAADVFAWGTVLCYAAGAAPFGDGSAATVIGAILTRPPRLDTIPTPLLDIVSAALEKDPTRRPTPAQLLDTLSDGTSSDGWLPPPVQAMLPEHTLPDITRPIAPPASTADDGTDVIDGGRTARIDGPPQQQPTRQQPIQHTRHYAGPPPDPTPTPPPPSRTRNPALAISVAIGATLLIVIAIVIGITLSGQGSTAAGPTSTAAPATETPTETTAEAPSETPTPEPSTLPAAPQRFVGNWQTVDGSPIDVAMRISQPDTSTSIYEIGIQIIGSPECRGQDAAGETRASPSDAVLSTSWVLNCANGSSGTLDETYTYDASSDQLTDTKGLTYYRIR